MAILALLWAVPVPAQPSVTAVRISSIEKLTRISIAFSEATQFRAFVLGDPYRLVVEFPTVKWELDRTQTYGEGIVKAWRFGAVQGGTMRLVFDLSRPMRLQKNFALRPTERVKEWRLVIDLEPVSKDEFDREQRGQRGKIGRPAWAADTEAEAEKAETGKGEAPLIVVDPGHGGVDPGAIGPGGTQEKDVTLALAKDLRDKIWQSGRYRVLLTRSHDYYVPLRQRYEIARAAGAALFVSLHADSSPFKTVKGLSIYTLSATASDREAAALAGRENKSDAVAGYDLGAESDSVANVLIDLAQRATKAQSLRFARALLPEVSRAVAVVEKPLRAAGFAVLKAPDVPSVLIETGHLSNPNEEKLLTDAAHRQKLAAALLAAIDRYFNDKLADRE